MLTTRHGRIYKGGKQLSPLAAQHEADKRHFATTQELAADISRLPAPQNVARALEQIRYLLSAFPLPSMAVITMACTENLISLETNNLPEAATPFRAEMLATHIKHAWAVADRDQERYGTPDIATITDQIAAHWQRVCEESVCLSCGKALPLNGPVGYCYCDRCGSSRIESKEATP